MLKRTREGLDGDHQASAKSKRTTLYQASGISVDVQVQVRSVVRAPPWLCMINCSNEGGSDASPTCFDFTWRHARMKYAANDPIEKYLVIKYSALGNVHRACQIRMNSESRAQTTSHTC
jgi:hypothetical protein